MSQPASRVVSSPRQWGDLPYLRPTHKKWSIVSQPSAKPLAQPSFSARFPSAAAPSPRPASGVSARVHSVATSSLRPAGVVSGRPWTTRQCVPPQSKLTLKKPAKPLNRPSLPFHNLFHAFKIHSQAIFVRIIKKSLPRDQEHLWDQI